MTAQTLTIPRPTATSTAQPAVETMRAVVQSGYGGVEVLQLGASARPRPGEGEVLVQVHAAGLDRGTWHLMTGRPYLMRLMGFGFRRPKDPVVGRDLAGTVVELGPGVTRFAIGDVVFGIGNGSFAEYACARVDKLALAPTRLELDEAAVLGVSGSTALQALRAVGPIAPGERVLVIGASGGVGTYAVQLAKHYGAHVTGVCSTAKVEFVRSLGADRVIDYTRESFTDERYDVVLDIGGGTPLSRLRRAMTPTARLVFVGNEHGGDWSAGFGRPLAALVLGRFVKQRFVMLAHHENAEDLEHLAELADAGVVTPAIDRRCGLHEVVDAMRDLETGHVRGKVAVVVNANARCRSSQ